MAVKERKLCPRCGLAGSGPYNRWVLNARHRKYEPYAYFAHKAGKTIHWCYLGKAEKLDNSTDGSPD